MINWLRSRRPKPRPEPAPVIEFQTRQVGTALVVSTSAGPGWHSMALAGSIPADPGRTVVVVDFPRGGGGGYWNALVQALRGRGPVRLAVSGSGSGGPTAAAQWLADQLRTEVIAPDGTLVPVPGGSTFVANAHATGAWRRFQVDEPSEALGARFPSPEWEPMMTTAPWRAGPVAVAEPIPAGLWLHATPVASNRRHSTLAFGVPVRMNVLTVVLGGPQEPALPAAELRALWEALPEEIRRRVRFASFGADLGPFAADALGQPVVSFPGLPVSSTRGVDIGIVTPDGRPTWRAYATELRYQPGGGAEVLAARAPLPGLKALRPGVFELSSTVVVEAVPSGLWVRPAAEPADPAQVRGLPVDPEWARLTVGVPGESVPDEVSAAGAKLFAGLDADTQRVARLVFGEIAKPSEPAVDPLRESVVEPVVESIVAPAAVPTTVEAPAESEADYDIGDLPTMVLLRQHRMLGQRTPDKPEPPVEPPPVPVRVLVDPAFDIDTVLDALAAGETKLDDHRMWMRKTLGAQYDTYASKVLRLLTQKPALRVGKLKAIVTDLVAVQVYLAAGERKADEALLSGDIDALLPFLCCVVSGLQRLPVYEGVAFSGGTFDPSVHRPGAVLTEVTFLNAVTAEQVSLPGETEFVIWSDSGRRTTVFEPELDPVVFLPGTRFQVLAARKDQVLLGEVGGGAQLARLEVATLARRPGTLSANIARFNRSIGTPPPRESRSVAHRM